MSKVDKGQMSVDAMIMYHTIKNDKLLPFKKGNLKNSITGEIHYNKQEIVFSIPGSKVKYAQFLQEGTRPHDIPHAFGYGSIYPGRPNPYTGEKPYGKGGRFEGKWHPGSKKHVGFVDYVLVNDCVNYFVENYDVERIDMIGSSFFL